MRKWEVRKMVCAQVGRAQKNCAQKIVRKKIVRKWVQIHFIYRLTFSRAWVLEKKFRLSLTWIILKHSRLKFLKMVQFFHMRKNLQILSSSLSNYWSEWFFIPDFDAVCFDYECRLACLSLNILFLSCLFKVSLFTFLHEIFECGL